MEVNDFYDEFGPEKILRVYDPSSGMRGFVVIDNTALGPAKGGIRMTETVDVEEVFRLARTMTWKCALANLPFGGGKSGIVYDEKKNIKMDYIKAFSKMIKVVSPIEYVAAPDINTSEKEMEAFVETNGNFNSATGKPLSICKIFNGKKTCGLPHELGSTGYGISYVTQSALKHRKMDITKARIAIEGFGNVGSFAFESLEGAGARIVAISDSKGCLYNDDGISFDEIKEVKKKTGSVVNGKGRRLKGSEIFELPVDVLIPAALPDVINENNMNRVMAKIIVEAANIPIPLDIEERLSKRILIVPDILANAGGVISSYAEYIGKDKDYMHKIVKEKLSANTKQVLDAAFKRKITPREAAMEIAVKRVRNAMRKR